MNTYLFQYVKHTRATLMLTIACGILATIVMIAQIVFLSRIVNSVFLFHTGLASLGLLLALLLGAIVARAFLACAREVTAQEGAICIKSTLRKRLFAHLLQLGPAYSKGESTGELVTTLNEGIERLDAYVSRYLPQVVLSVVAPLLIVAYIFPLDWTSTVLLLVTGPVITLLMFLVGSYSEKHVQRQWLALSRMSGHFLDVVQGLPTLKLFGRSEGAQERIGRSSDSFREKMLRIAFLSGMVLEFMTAAAIGLIAVTLGVRLINGGISFASAFLVLLLAPEFYRPLRELGVQRHAGMEGKAAAKRMGEILQTPVPINTSAASARRLASTRSSVAEPAPLPVRPWREMKSRRGAPKRVNTEGFACPNRKCLYSGITDAHIHALVGDGKHGHAERIQTFRCQACRTKFTARRHTPLYRLKTPSHHIGMVLSALAEGLDASAAERVFGYRQATITSLSDSRWRARTDLARALLPQPTDPPPPAG